MDGIFPDRFSLSGMRPGVHDHVFADARVRLGAGDLRTMIAAIRAVEIAADHPAIRDAALADADPIARVDGGTRGVFMGYDFHLTPEGPRLIEINTNAGGAFLNAVREGRRAAFQAEVAAMFRAEWSRARPNGGPLRRVAIVDDDPEEQYLHPEFLIARDMLSAEGIETRIVDARALVVRDDRLEAGGWEIDLVYNRCCDFNLVAPGHAAAREAVLRRLAVFTPDPHRHALLAEKRGLIRFSDTVALGAAGVPTETVAAIAAVMPEAVAVTPENVPDLRRRRAGLFFKPLDGYGARGVYRGDKVTARVWAEISRGGHIAQALVPPSITAVEVDGKVVPMKTDIRVHTHDARMLGLSARLYTGQTTNFRTPGGGFAPVEVVPER